METTNIERIWKSGGSLFPEQPFPDQTILRKKGRKNLRKNQVVILVYLGLYLAMLAFTFIMEIVNLYGYRGNTAWEAAHSGILVLTAGFMAYGIYLTIFFLKMNRTTSDLMTSIQNQIRFYKKHYEVWLVMIPLACVMLSIAISTFTDNDNGHYRINQIGVFAGTLIGMVVFLYATMKAVHFPLIHELRVYLSDLEAQSTEATNRYEIRKRKWRWWVAGAMVVLMGVLVYLLVLGIMKYS